MLYCGRGRRLLKMAAADLFQPTPSLRKAASLINGLDSGRLARLITRVMQKLHLKGERAFSAEEEERLQPALGLDTRQLSLVLDTVTFVLQQAAYHLAKPALLSQHLLRLGLSEEMVQVFLQAWSSQGKAVVEKLRSQTFYPKQLEEVNWRLSLQMAQSSQAKMKQPSAVFELAVKEGEEMDRVRVEFTHEEMFDFYQKLEAIQGQLDSLS